MKEQQKHLQLPEQPNKYDLNHQVTNQFYAMASSFPPPDSNIGAITFDTGNQFNQRMTQQQQQNSHMPGSAEHTRLKKETHREVERRRRETINNGIQQLSDLIPGGEKNKGRIIMRAIQYIHELKASEASNIEKFTLEKMIFERA